METVYFWLVNRLSRNPNRPVTVWLWRRTLICREIGKHIRRGNLGQAVCYLRML